MAITSLIDLDCQDLIELKSEIANKNHRVQSEQDEEERTRQPAVRMREVNDIDEDDTEVQPNKLVTLAANISFKCLGCHLLHNSKYNIKLRK